MSEIIGYVASVVTWENLRPTVLIGIPSLVSLVALIVTIDREHNG